MLKRSPGTILSEMSEGKKGKNRARRRVAIKTRVKGKVMIGKVDRSRSPPFRLVLR